MTNFQLCINSLCLLCFMRYSVVKETTNKRALVSLYSCNVYSFALKCRYQNSFCSKNELMLKITEFEQGMDTKKLPLFYLE